MSGCYQVSRTMLLGHAHAWRLYDSEYRAKQNGVISITLNSDWAEPANPANQEDKDAADFYLQVKELIKCLDFVMCVRCNLASYLPMLPFSVMFQSTTSVLWVGLLILSMSMVIILRR